MILVAVEHELILTKKTELKVDYSDFFENKVGIEKLKWKGDQGIGCCPIPSHDDIHPSFSCNGQTGQWYCHSCGEKGNAYTLAKTLEMPNPNQYLNIPSTLMKNGHNEAINPLKTEVKQRTDIEENKSRYASQLPDDIKQKLDSYEQIGMDDANRLTFHYPTGIKHHKGKNGEAPYWEGDGHCQIFMEERLADHPTDKPLYIFEGEKDAIVSPFKGIAFSAGAGSIPKDITCLYDFNTIYILYDNDHSGKDGAEKLAERIKEEAPSCKVFIIQWGESLPKGYDVWDEWKASIENQNYHYDELDKAIANAMEFKLKLPKKIGAFTIMTGAEATITTPPPTEWLIENVLPKKFNSCLAGTTGSKKSMWAIQLSMCLANGEKDFCGNKIESKGIKVLYVDTEIGQDELHRRYHKIRIHMDWVGDDNIILMSKGGYHVDVWDDVHKAISSYGPKLIVFDSLYNTTTVGDFSKSAQMSKVTNALTQFKEMYGVSVLAIAHFNKGQHELGLMIDRMQGSAVLQNWVEFQMLMISTNVDDFNLWTVGKARGVRHDKSIIGLKWENFWFETEGVVDDIKPFLFTEHKRQNWMVVLEDCPDEFDSQQWLNVFQSKFSRNERTGRRWLKECSESPTIKKLAHNLYQKNLRIINEHNIDE